MQTDWLHDTLLVQTFLDYKHLLMYFTNNVMYRNRGRIYSEECMWKRCSFTTSSHLMKPFPEASREFPCASFSFLLAKRNMNPVKNQWQTPTEDAVVLHVSPHKNLSLKSQQLFPKDNSDGSKGSQKFWDIKNVLFHLRRNLKFLCYSSSEKDHWKVSDNTFPLPFLVLILLTFSKIRLFLCGLVRR